MIDQGELFDIPNPCKGICEVNDKGFCKGCLRSRQERFHWQEMSPFQKQLVVNLCNKRRLKLLAAKQLSTSEEEQAIQSSHQVDMFSKPTDSSPGEEYENDRLPAPSDQLDNKPLSHSKLTGKNAKRETSDRSSPLTADDSETGPEKASKPHPLRSQSAPPAQEPKQQFGLFD
jgi:predicted Fe-S protein YdhL (DUF1289 family)